MALFLRLIIHTWGLVLPRQEFVWTAIVCINQDYRASLLENQEIWN